MSIEKVVMNYNSDTGDLTDKNGLFIISLQNLQAEKYEDQAGIDELVKLKNAGFTTDEIIELRRKELI